MITQPNHPGASLPPAVCSFMTPRWARGFCAVVTVLCLNGSLRADANDAGAGDHQVKEFLATYCIDCHGADSQSGDRRFDTLALPAARVETLELLKEIIDQVNLGDMPPREADQPSADSLQAFIEQATQSLKEGRESVASTGGTAVLRRLNRREYINTVGDLFGLNMAAFDPTATFPRDQSAEHMDNLGDVLTTSGYLLDHYLDAADEIIEKVFASKQQPPIREWHFKDNLRGKPKTKKNAEASDANRFLGVYECMDSDKHTLGYAFLHDFREGVPFDGMYEIRFRAHAMNRKNPYDPEIFGIDAREPFRLGIVPGDDTIGPLDLPQPNQPILAEAVMGDGDPEWYTAKVWLDAGRTIRFVFPNGPKDFRKSWFKVAEYHKDKWPPIKPGDRLRIVDAARIAVDEGKMPHIRIHEVIVRGPLPELVPEALKSSVVRRAILDESAVDPQKMRRVLQFFANRAYRRPATADEVDRLMAVAEARISAGRTPEEGLKDALKTALCSPGFLYLSQETLSPDNEAISDAGNRGRPRLNGYAVAARLSYFLWSSMPDKELFQVATSGELTKPEVVRAQALRMLNHQKSDAFVAGFLDSWLNLRSLGGMPPDRRDYDFYYFQNLEHAFKEETRLFMRDLIDTDGSILHFLDCDYSFVNQPLATLYGLGDLGDPSKAHEFRKVRFTDATRGGLLGMGSVLTVSANGIETSPVVRGVFLLENILGTPPPPPPDDVPAIDPDVRGATSIRDLLSKHRESPSCYSCHRKIDPLGFALENFDPVGGFRKRIGKAKVDPSGELPSGEKFSDVAGLKKVLLKRKNLFVRMLTGRLMTYACGRRTEATDDRVIEEIAATLPSHDYGLRSLIEAIVTSELFLCR
jgi:hypothetical protein